MGILMIIIIFILAVTIDKNQREIKELKNKIKKLIDENNKLKLIIQKMKEGSTVDFNIEQVQQVVQQKVQPAQVVQAKAVEPKIVVEPKVEQRKVVNKEQIKNTTILLTGAFLIILAAIILLLSTWNIMPNFIKTVVLFMFVGVFLGISKKAEAMGLKDTSKTFFNLAMAYLPICFISVSLFGLLGEFLSISGDGKFIYLTAVFLAMAGAYYKFSKTRKSKGLFYSSILSQLFTVVLFSLIFETNINLVVLNLALYNILLLIVPERDNMINIVNVILSYLGLIICICIAIFDVTSFIGIFALLAIFATFAIMAKRNPNYANGFSLNIAIIATLLSLVRVELFNFNINIKLSFMIIGMFASLIIEENLLSGNKYKNIKYSNYILSHVFMFFAYMVAIFNEEVVFMKPYIIALLTSALSMITYLKYKNGFFAVTMPLAFTVFSIGLFDGVKINFSYHGMVITGIAQFVIFKLFSAVYKDSKKWIEPTINAILAWIILLALLDYSSKFINDFGYFLLIFALYGFSEFVSKTKLEEGIYRVLSYCSSLFVLISFFTLIFESPDLIISYTPLIITIVAIVLENMYSKFDDKLNKTIINIGAVLACIAISVNDGALHGMLLGITAIVTLVYNRFKNQNQALDLPIMFVVWFAILTRSGEEEALKAILMLAFTAFSTIMSIRNQKINFYSVMSYIYLFSFMQFSANEYINTLLFLINSLVHIPYMEVEKDKDIFKFLSCATGLTFYLNFVDDFVKIDMISIKLAGWLLLSVYTHNKILNKYIKNSKVLRIITYVIVYWVGTAGAFETLDKMLLMFMELVVIVYSYNERLEAEFISTIVMLIIQAFLLTSSFWFAVPWWIYLIIIGGTLIAFGISNESRETKNNALKEFYNNRFKK